MSAVKTFLFTNLRFCGSGMHITRLRPACNCKESLWSFAMLWLYRLVNLQLLICMKI